MGVTKSHQASPTTFTWCSLSLLKWVMVPVYIWKQSGSRSMKVNGHNPLTQQFYMMVSSWFDQCHLSKSHFKIWFWFFGVKVTVKVKYHIYFSCHFLKLSSSFGFGLIPWVVPNILQWTLLFSSHNVFIVVLTFFQEKVNSKKSSPLSLYKVIYLESILAGPKIKAKAKSVHMANFWVTIDLITSDTIFGVQICLFFVCRPISWKTNLFCDFFRFTWVGNTLVVNNI